MEQKRKFKPNAAYYVTDASRLSALLLYAYNHYTSFHSYCDSLAKKRKLEAEPMIRVLVNGLVHNPIITSRPEYSNLLNSYELKHIPDSNVIALCCGVVFKVLLEKHEVRYKDVFSSKDLKTFRELKLVSSKPSLVGYSVTTLKSLKRILGKYKP